MDAFFKELGRNVLERWKRKNFSLESFPGIACAVLAESPPSENIDLASFMRGFLLDDEQPSQTQSGFGQPEIVAYDHPRFYIQLLFWLEGTTEIHQHEFSGAFHVMHGSSIHALYGFENSRPVTPHLRVGDVRMREIELLETGRTVPIVSGQGCIHSLFHLDTPSVTVVIRTQNDPGTSPQFNYQPPHLAVDPLYHDSLLVRRRQLLDVLEQTGDPSYAGLVLEMIAEADFESGYHLLHHCMDHLANLGEWETTLAAFEEKHGGLASGIAATLEENRRRDTIKALRGTVTEPEHRFFLALLMNVTNRADLLALVARRFPGEKPAATVLRWADELAGDPDCGTALLDASFPETLDIAEEDQPAVFRAALKHFLEDAKKVPASLKKLSPADWKLLKAVFAASSLRALVM